jgi:hypothetical protein
VIDISGIDVEKLKLKEFEKNEHRKVDYLVSPRFKNRGQSSARGRDFGGNGITHLYLRRQLRGLLENGGSQPLVATS